MDIEAKLRLADRIKTLRAQLAEAEAEFAGVPKRPGPTPKGKGSGPSIRQRVLNLVQEAGPGGIARKDILGIVGKAHESAVHSALKSHQQAGVLKSNNGVWVAKGSAKVKPEEFLSPPAR